MTSHEHPADADRFSLSRWFAVVALTTIGVLAVAMGLLLDHFIAQRLLWQEALLTREFVQSLLRGDERWMASMTDLSRGVDAEAEAAFARIAAMPNMIRTKVYGAQRQVVWSSDPRQVGRAGGSNAELDGALAGDVVSHLVEHPAQGSGKTEHDDLGAARSRFVEIYVPIVDAGTGRVAGVIEFYKDPKALAGARSQLRTYIAAGTAFSAAALFVALFALVRRADLTMRRQQRRLLDNEKLAVIGEMGAAVAHGIRNPLASIRSSAELMSAGDLALAREAASDIVGQSDRLEAWVADLLAHARPTDAAVGAIPMQPLVARCMAEIHGEARRRQIKAVTWIAPDVPAAHGNALLLGQVLSSLLANAIEALERGGEITVRAEAGRRRAEVLLSVRDNGPGMSKSQVQSAGREFQTSKVGGLGFGLAQARRIIERFGGRMEIDSRLGKGTTVRLFIPAA